MATPTALRIFSPESGLRPKPVEGSAGTIPAGLYGKTAHPYSRGTCWARRKHQTSLIALLTIPAKNVIAEPMIPNTIHVTRNQERKSPECSVH